MGRSAEGHASGDSAGQLRERPLLRRSIDFESLAANGTASRDLSLLLLDLYALAGRTGIGEFESGLFRLLSGYLPFDSGWTGVTTHTATGPVMHNSFLYRLPARFFADWKQVRECDPLAHATISTYGKAFGISAVAPGADPRFREWAQRFELAQMMVVASLDHRFGLATFLSVYRRSPDQRFTAADARKLEDVIPHLAAALKMNRSFQLTRERSEATTAVARAICDGFGEVHQADKAFQTLLNSEWPNYQNQQLPAPLIAYLHNQTNQPYVGDTVYLNCSPVAGLFQLEARRRSPLDRLSARELAAIRLYGDGLPAKEVARRLSISPTTVRHYLRSAYTKLNTHDKGQLAWLLGQHDDAAQAAADGAVTQTGPGG